MAHEEDLGRRSTSSSGLSQRSASLSRFTWKKKNTPRGLRDRLVSIAQIVEHEDLTDLFLLPAMPRGISESFERKALDKS